jgi:hypothetical protein
MESMFVCYVHVIVVYDVCDDPESPITHHPSPPPPRPGARQTEASDGSLDRTSTAQLYNALQRSTAGQGTDPPQIATDQQ